MMWAKWRAFFDTSGFEARNRSEIEVMRLCNTESEVEVGEGAICSVWIEGNDIQMHW